MALKIFLKEGDFVFDVGDETLKIVVFFFEKIKIFVLLGCNFLKTGLKLSKLVLLHAFRQLLLQVFDVQF